MLAANQAGAAMIMVVTVGLSLIGMYASAKIVNACLFRPYYFLRDRQYSTIITSGFVHADLGHLLFNMFTFWFFAFPMERFLGTIPFLLLYLTGLIVSHACTFFKHRENPRYASLGASGAISAVLFAYIVYFPTTTLMIIPIPIPIPAVLFAVGYVAYSYWAATQARDNINHDAHLCGAISGLVFVAVTNPVAFRHLLSMFG